MPPGHRPAQSVPRARQEDEPSPVPRPARGPQNEAPRPSREAPKQARQGQSHRREPESKLSAMESRILSFEARWWRASGAKTQAISDELELTPERYYQQLARLIEHPAAASEQPAVVRRLRAARDERRAAR
ncbi:DUF3263 domain-containing protein [Glycomyces harbinensis]|uniref:DUF3263 domain-containing protein n=1 Tax=Glycomyces harbinensis TaxID=58114 RepID=A0A1G6UYW4_9ACTN|nr:DUF3263 domain-containing protein [Glycomyces harbinensis]SDD46502.1 Protein of unknown function [Glycomyces harbinensis]